MPSLLTEEDLKQTTPGIQSSLLTSEDLAASSSPLDFAPKFYTERDNTTPAFPTKTQSSSENPLVVSKYKPSLPPGEDQARVKTHLPVDRNTQKEVEYLKLLMPQVDFVLAIQAGSRNAMRFIGTAVRETSKWMADITGNEEIYRDMVDSEDSVEKIQAEIAAANFRFGGYDPESPIEVLGQGLGTTIPVLLGTAVGGPVAGAGLGAAIGGGAGAEDAKMHQATQDEIYRSLAVNGAFGLAESLPMQKALNVIDKVTGGVASNNITKAFHRVTGGKLKTPQAIEGVLSNWDQTKLVFQQAGEVAVVEGLQETVQQLGLNWNAIESYDPSRELTEGLGGAAAGGTGVGGIIGGLMSLYGLRSRRVMTIEERDAIADKWLRKEISNEEFAETLPVEDHLRRMMEEQILPLNEEIFAEGVSETTGAGEGIIVPEMGSVLPGRIETSLTEAEGLLAQPESQKALADPMVAKVSRDPSIGFLSHGVENELVDPRHLTPEVAVTKKWPTVGEAVQPGAVVFGKFPRITPKSTKELLNYSVSEEELKATTVEAQQKYSVFMNSVSELVLDVSKLFADPLTGEIPAFSITSMDSQIWGGRAGFVRHPQRVLGMELELSPLREASVLSRVYRDVYEQAVADTMSVVGHELSHLLIMQKFGPFFHAEQGDYSFFPGIDDRLTAIDGDLTEAVVSLQREAMKLDSNINAQDEETKLYSQASLAKEAVLNEVKNKIEKSPDYQVYKALRTIHEAWLVENQDKGRTLGNFIFSSGDLKEFKDIQIGGTLISEDALDTFFTKTWKELAKSKEGRIFQGSSSDIRYYQNFHEFAARIMADQITLDFALTPFQSKAIEVIRERQRVVYDALMKVPAYKKYRLPFGAYLRQLSLTSQLQELVRKRMQGTLSPVEAVMRLDVETGKLKGEARPSPVGKRVLPESGPRESVGISVDPGNPPPPQNTEALNSDFEDWNTKQDTYNNFYSWGLGILHLAKLNPHIPSIQNYTQLLREFSNERGKRIFKAQNIHNSWRRLGKEQANKLSKVLLEETLSGKFKTAEELFVDLDDEALAVKEQVQDFMITEVLRPMEKALIDEAIRAYKNDVFAQSVRLNEITAKFTALRGQPYFPLMRFGKFAVQIRDRKGKQIYFESFESNRERNQRLAELRKERDLAPADNPLFGGKVTAIDMTDHMLAVQGMPVDFAKLYVERLAATGVPLTPEQIKQLEDLSFETSQAKGFMKLFKKRRGIAGFSTDGLRAFASYAMGASNHLARVQYAPLLRDEISNLRAQTKYIRNTAPESESTVKRDQMGDYLDEHFKYLLNPENEWAGLRAAAFTWFLGFNLKSALLNTMQLPMVAYPYLGARYGDAAAVGGLTKAGKDLTKYVSKGPSTLLEDEIKLLQQGKADGWLDEGMTTELAMASREHRLDRMLPGNMAKRFIQKIPQYSAVFFHTAEKVNRNIVALATYRLAREKGMDFKKAYFAAERAVEETQFIYDRWNRAPLFRGKKGSLLVFMSFVQNTLVFAAADKGASRWWMMQLMMGGIIGLPFAEDLLDLLSAGWNGFQKLFNTNKPYKDFEVELRRELVATVGEIGLNPDLLLHGLSRESFGLANLPILENYPLPRIDLSGSMSMGNILPLTEDVKALAAGQKLDEFMVRGAENIGGAGFAPYLNITRALASNDPNEWRRWEKALPTALHSASQAYRMYTENGETTQRSDVIAVFDPHDLRDRAELILKAMSFQPTKLTEGWEKEIAQREHVAFYKVQKSMLLKDLNYARIQGDREGIADAKRAIKNYNSSVPYKEMGISNKEARQSFKAYKSIHKKAGHNVAMEREYRRLENELAGVFDPYEADISDSREESLQ